MKHITSVACDTYLPMQKHIAHTIPPIAMMIPKIITVTYSILQSAKNTITLNNKENIVQGTSYTNISLSRSLTKTRGKASRDTERLTEKIAYDRNSSSDVTFRNMVYTKLILRTKDNKTSYHNCSL